MRELLTQTVVEPRGWLSAGPWLQELCQRGRLAPCLCITPAPALCHMAPTQAACRESAKRKEKTLYRYFESSHVDLLFKKKKK